MLTQATSRLFNAAVPKLATKAFFSTKVSVVDSAKNFSSAAAAYEAPALDMGINSEFSVVFTDRSLNHMAQPFQQVMNDLNHTLTTTYNCSKSIIMPGSGSYGMEAVARQFASPEDHVMVMRQGWFSYRWTEMFDQPGANLVASHTVLKALPLKEGVNPSFGPWDVDAVIAKVNLEKPKVFFTPQVETSTGIMLPDEYIRKVSDAVHANGGIFVLDCIASGTIWCDMTKCGVDVLISAPQKGWSGPAGSALLMLSDRALAQLPVTCSSSFALSLNKWDTIMNAYLEGGHAYHTTMPTDSIRQFHEVTKEMESIGMEELKQRQTELGAKSRKMFEDRGLKSVAGAILPPRESWCTILRRSTTTQPWSRGSWRRRCRSPWVCPG